jgi:AraC-like DNA-binding protein
MKAKRQPSLPVIRLSLLKPVVETLENSRLVIEEVFSEFSIKNENIDDPEFWIPATKLYALVERLAEISGDPYFGVHSGEQLDPWSWSPTANAARTSSTVSEFLLKFMCDSQEDVNSCVYILNTVNDRTTFREQRVADGGILPQHNDGYTVTYLLAILRGAVGPAWDGSKVIARVCDPEVIPPGYLGIRTAKTDTMGASVSFPTSWLLLLVKPDSSASVDHTVKITEFPANNIVDAFQYAVTPYIHEPVLGSDRAAELCKMSKRTLARRLEAQGTTTIQEISRMRRARAEQQLRETGQSIARIASSVGYSDPAVFSRAFKRWTGLAPSQYRKNSRTILNEFL